MRTICGLGLLALCVAGAGLAPVRADDPNRRELLAAFEKQLQETAATAGPSIACVVVSRSEFYPKVKSALDVPGKLGTFDAKEFLKSSATPERAKLARLLDLANPEGIADHGYAGGVVIDAAGYVLTPYHVIEGATKVYVYLPGGSGSYADIHAADARCDLAVLKLINLPAKAKITPIKFADVRTTGRNPTVSTGKLCVLMANPYSSTFGVGQPSAAFGNITNVRYRLQPKEGTARTKGGKQYVEYGHLLEYDVKLNAGVTGAALLTLDGELMGLANAGAVGFDDQPVGAGRAVPIDKNFQRIIEVLKRGEEVEYGFLGVRQAVAGLPGGGDFRGVDPMPGCAAADAGIRSGDIIKTINGTPVSGFDDLLLHIGSALAGTKITVTVTSGNGNGDREVEVTLGKLRHELPQIASVRPDSVFGLRVDYSSMLAQQLNDGIPRGVSVREVIADSPAAKQFKALGDAPTKWLITHVDQAEVTSPAAFNKAVKGREKIKLTVIDPAERPRREREVTLP